MSIYLRNVLTVISLAALASSCVSQKQYGDLLKDKDRLDVNVERAHKEIRELKESKLNLEDQIKVKNIEIEKLDQQVKSYKRQALELTDKFSVLEEQMQRMSADLELKKTESAALITSYEQRISELQQASSKIKSLKGKKKIVKPSTK